MYINSDNYAASGIKVFTFPGGEPHVQVPHIFLTNGERVFLDLRLRTWLDCGYGSLVMAALSKQVSSDDLFVYIPYFPGARQDKATHMSLEPFALGLYAAMFPIKNLLVIDPHSDELNKVRAQFALPAVLQIDPYEIPFTAHNPPVVGIIAPDEGAVRRATGFKNNNFPLARMYWCSKTRDISTGRITSYECPQLEEPGTYIVVDDICDGGATFNLLAKGFREDKFFKESRFELFVSHGIFSKGLDNIDPMYEFITTTDSWCCLPSSKRLTVIKTLSIAIAKFAVQPGE